MLLCALTAVSLSVPDWAYKDSKRRGTAEELYNTPWLSSIKEWQNDRISSRDFVDSVRRELLGKRVFVFLRNGKILNLARGATAIDAAFQIHTEVGLNMHGVEINGKPVPLSYELQNGDVVSILTGEGKPATDWMRYAKSRSTRSKLRSYFRARQKESLREAGKILLTDYLWMHGPLIERESYLGYSFKAPTTVDELEEFLPGRCQYETVDELLIAVGMQHDRSMLHRVIAQIFEVPKKSLKASEDERRAVMPSSVEAAVHLKRRNAKDAALAVASAHGVAYNASTMAFSTDQTTEDSASSIETLLLSGLDIDVEDADPEQICEACLPVHGDQIVGTRPISDGKGGDDDDDSSVTMVHRVGCAHAQRAINDAQAQLRNIHDERSIPRVDSVSLRQQEHFNIWKMPKLNGRSTRTRNKSTAYRAKEVPVKLYWLDMDDMKFLAEIVVHSQDRKLLLADCSEVVSETVEIVKTVSQTTEEHAILTFLVRITGLPQLQQLMDRLKNVRSVMSVERRFGSELL